MPSKRDRLKAYKEVTFRYPELNIRERSASWYYGEWIPRIVEFPDQVGLPSWYAATKDWTQATIAPEYAEYLWHKPYHPRAPAAVEWPNLRKDWLIELINGKAPVDIVNSRFSYGEIKLNSKEATEYLYAWCQSEHMELEGGLVLTIHQFLAHKLFTRDVWGNNYYRFRSRKIYNYIARHKDEIVKLNYLHRLDEIREEDITDISLRPKHLFEVIDDRKNPYQKFGKFPYTLLKGMDYLADTKMLNQESERMRHCVKNYGPRCKAGDAYIIRLPRSTAEINRSGEVYQHRGFANASPPAEDIELLRKWKHERRKVI